MDMRSFGARAVFVVAVLAFARMAFAQTVDDIIEKSLTAQGGREALGKITSRLTKGSMVVNSPAGDLPGTIEVPNQAPNKVRTLINLDLTAAGAGSLTLATLRGESAAAHSVLSAERVIGVRREVDAGRWRRTRRLGQRE